MIVGSRVYNRIRSIETLTTVQDNTAPELKLMIYSRPITLFAKQFVIALKPLLY